MVITTSTPCSIQLPQTLHTENVKFPCCPNHVQLVYSNLKNNLWAIQTLSDVGDYIGTVLATAEKFGSTLKLTEPHDLERPNLALVHYIYNCDGNYKLDTFNPLTNDKSTYKFKQITLPNLITSYNISPLKNLSKIRISNIDGKKYLVLNNNYVYDPYRKYKLGKGIYHLEHSTNHPLGIITSGSSNALAYTGTHLVKTLSVMLDGSKKKVSYYLGNILLHVNDDFEDGTIHCLNHGLMGGKDILKYDSSNDNIISESSSNQLKSFLTNDNINACVEKWLVSDTRQQIVDQYGEIGDWDTKNVTDMKELFKDDPKTRPTKEFNEDISNWHTSNVSTMAGMFEGAAAFDKDISGWNTQNVKDMSSMFNFAAKFNFGNTGNKLKGNWDTSNVIDMNNMFNGTHVFNQNINGWDMHNVQSTDFMFMEALAFNQDISSWNTSNISGTSGMFINAISFNRDISKWDTSNVTSMSGMFYQGSVFNQPINSWSTNKVTQMDLMFYGAEAFNQDIGSWNTQNVIDMREMFKGCKVFNQDISSWKTSQVGDMSGMFYNAEAFNYPVKTSNMVWNTSGVSNMSNMFFGAAEFNQDVSNWDISKVTDIGGMFNGAAKFNNNMNSSSNWDWNTSNVMDTNGMLANTSQFNQNISSWNTIKVTNMSRMFANAEKFNNPLNRNGNNWNTQNVRNMANMFNNAVVFNQDISNWNTLNVANMTGMFSRAEAFNYDITNWNVNNIEICSYFYGQSSLDSNKLPPFKDGCVPGTVSPPLNPFTPSLSDART